MPRAYRDRYSARVPREYYEHAHDVPPNSWPPLLAFEEDARIYWKCPANWNGFSLVRLWFRGTVVDAAMPLNMTVNAGTCTEAYNIHTQTDNTVSIATTVGTYTCLDITTTFATVLALITSCDLVEFNVANMDDTNSVYMMGVEIVES